LDALKAKLDSEMKQVASSLTSGNTVNEQRVEDIRAALDAQKKRVLDLRARRDEVAVLQKDVENAQRAYDVGAQRLFQTSLESQAQQTNIQLLSEALPPTRKSSPRTMWNLMMATLFGAILGGVAAFFHEFSDGRMREAEDAARAFGWPVLTRLLPPRRSLGVRLLDAVGLGGRRRYGTM
jgi:uncharacterized protein involved in exopolysaccharide biosynthesis